MDKKTAEERLGKIIELGESVISTIFKARVGHDLNNDLYSQWETQAKAFLADLGRDSYSSQFHSQVPLQGFRTVNIKEGNSVLKGLLSDIRADYISFAKREVISPIAGIQIIIEKFFSVARQLRVNRKGKTALDIQDEYDVQYLFHALLKLYYLDIRPEEWTPSYAAKSSRMDFLLKNEQIVIELKKTRDDLRGKEVADQLIIDIDRYKVHPDCKQLICFVYDPEGLIANPKGVETDLSGMRNGLPVTIYIRPSE